MIKVTKLEYEDFKRDFMNGVYHPDLRFGQMFINIFYEKFKDMMPDPLIFYERDMDKAKYYIEIKYVE